MAEIEKIENLDQLEGWLKTQDVRMSRTIAARAALRALPALMAVSDQFFNKTPGTILLLAGLRASLISGVAGNCPTPDMKNLQDAASSASSAAASASAASSAAARSAAASAARSAAASAASAARSSARSAAASAARSSARSAAASAASAAAFLDATVGQDLGFAAVFGHPLWPEGKAVAPLLAHWDTFEARPDPEGIWSFWREWYRGMLNGEPLDWDLQLQIALIKPEIWDAGPEAVAKKIDLIKHDFRSEPNSALNRAPEHEPKSVKHLIENRVVATACLQGLSVQITDVIERYHAETGANTLPDALLPLSDMPQLLNSLAGTLCSIPETGTASLGTEQQLREENGRLNAKIAELQEKIAALKSEISNLSEPEKKSYWTFLKQVALIGGLVSIAPTLAGGAWALSGDELGLKQRYENLILDWEFVKTLSAGKIPPPQGHTQTEVKESLRPVARPGRT